MIVTWMTVLLLCQLTGEVISHVARLPIPGPVIGMALLFCILLLRGEIPHSLQRTTDGLLQNLGLLFVPAGVGVMTQAQLLASEWQSIAAAVVASTALTIVVTAFLVRALDRRSADSDQ